MIQKSYQKSDLGILYLVPTPIGNLDDITLRAINVLKDVDLIFAEDTRETYKLLNKLNIKNKVESCHKYTENMHKEKILSELKTGKNIAFVSDRGTPMISDPGNYLVPYLISNGINVISLPGPSALLPALNMSGIDNEKFLFYGFLSSSEGELVKELKKLKNIPYTCVFYESPHRISHTISLFLDILGNRQVSIIREISKLHEEIFRGNLEEAITYCKSIKGEIVIVVSGNKKIEETVDYIFEVKKLIEQGMKKSTAVKEVSELYNISKNVLYEECKEL